MAEIIAVAERFEILQKKNIVDFGARDVFERPMSQVCCCASRVTQ